MSQFGGALQHGASEDSVRLGIVASQEYFAKQGSTPSGYVQALYQDLLGRTPAGNEAATWIAQAATDRSAVAVGFLRSQEYKTVQVKSFYTTLLRRDPDNGGLAHFVNELLAGQDQRSILHGILPSAEYFNSAANILWIGSLYRDVLGRDGNPEEIAGWLGALRGGVSVANLAEAFTSSTEAATNIVTGLYQRLLNRAPDALNLNTSVSLLQSTGHQARVIALITGSNEYIQNHGGTTDSFIKGIYQDVLARSPFALEITYWQDRIKSLNLTLAQVAAQIAGSIEYMQLYVAGLFNMFVRRSPATAELNQFVAQLQTGAMDSHLAAAILSSPEYFANVTS
jgi:hypothetical protein